MGPYWGATYSVSVVRQESVELLYRTRLRVDTKSWATWSQVDVDLSRFAGQRVVLRLDVVPDEPRHRVRFGWWGSPRIVASADGASAATAGSEGASRAP
jgi:hypothetical protein